jgi:putative salt-induced outer membrane protein YdiY
MPCAGQDFPMPVYRRCLLGLSCLLFTLPAHAIVSLENLHFGEPPMGFSGNLGLAMSGASGNTDKTDGKLSGNLYWVKAESMNYLLLSREYGRSLGQTDTDKAFLHLRHIQAIDADKDWEVFTQAERDKFARLTLRRLLGGGLRFPLRTRSGDLKLYWGLGGFYSQEKLEPRPGTSDQGEERLWRGNTYLLLHYRLNDTAGVHNTLYLQPKLGDAGDYRLLEQASLNITLSERLDLKLSLDITRDSRPPQGVEKTDINYLTGLAYHF